MATGTTQPVGLGSDRCVYLYWCAFGEGGQPQRDNIGHRDSAGRERERARERMSCGVGEGATWQGTCRCCPLGFLIGTTVHSIRIWWSLGLGLWTLRLPGNRRAARLQGREEGMRDAPPLQASSCACGCGLCNSAPPWPSMVWPTVPCSVYRDS